MIRIRWLPTLLLCSCMAAILALGAEGGKLLRDAGIQGRWLDLAHVIGFAALGALAISCLSGPRLRSALIAAAVCLAFAIVDEWHQGFIPWRGRSFSDVGYDLLGIAIGVLAVAIARAGSGRGPRASLSSEGESP